MMNKEVSNFCRDIIYLQKNQDIIEIYKLYSYNYQIFENYTFMIGTNDDTFIQQDILRQITNLKYDKFSFKSSLSAYKNILLLDKNLSRIKKNIDISINIDSNSLGLFIEKDKNSNSFIPKGIDSNPIAKFVFENNLDINPQPYIDEDLMNSNHTYSLEYEKELQKYNIKLNKLSALFKFQNLNVKDTSLLGNIVRRRIYYFTHNYLDEDCKLCRNMDGSPMYLDISKKEYWLNFNGFKYSNHTFIYSYVLLMFVISFKRISYSEKTIEFSKIMRKSGPIFLEVLNFAYEYFKDNSKMTEFMNFDIRQWNLDKIFQEAKNKAWDIFCFYGIQYIELFKNEKADFGVGFFLSGDKKFINDYIKFSKRRIVVINHREKTFQAIADTKELDKLLYENCFNNTLPPGYVKHKNLIALSLILKEYAEKRVKELKLAL
nr:hypothetical protein [uncultured Campylobacter sp.]